MPYTKEKTRTRSTAYAVVVTPHNSVRVLTAKFRPERRLRVNANTIGSGLMEHLTGTSP